jgi:hypothetical protein
VCNAPKTGEEERTGLGGGYNERGIVEYVEREGSDGEYDEFGRRKRKDSRGPPPVAPPPKKKTEEEEEEDDEEDDDDGDLSKYDLVASDDEEENEKKAERFVINTIFCTKLFLT